jgi:hypothetical protein
MGAKERSKAAAKGRVVVIRRQSCPFDCPRVKREGPTARTERRERSSDLPLAWKLASPVGPGSRWGAGEQVKPPLAGWAAPPGAQPRRRRAAGPPVAGRAAPAGPIVPIPPTGSISRIGLVGPRLSPQVPSGFGFAPSPRLCLQQRSERLAPAFARTSMQAKRRPPRPRPQPRRARSTDPLVSQHGPGPG